MFTERQLSILSILISKNDWVTSAKLAEYLNVSNKTIQKEVKQINSILGQQECIQSNNQKGYFASTLDDKIKGYVTSNTLKNIDPEAIFGRSKNIITLLLYEKDYISMGKIAERLFVSKATVNTDLAQVKRIINRRPGMYFDVSPIKGIYIHADENTKRHMLTLTMENKVDYAQLLNDKDFIRLDEMHKIIQSFLTNIFVNHNHIITGVAFKEFVDYIVISIMRSQKSFLMEPHSEEPVCFEMVEEIAEEIEKAFSYCISKDEKRAIKQKLSDMNLLKKQVLSGRQIQEKLSEFCNKVKEDLQIDLIDDDAVMTVLAHHIEQMIIRIQNHHSNINNFTREIIQRYPLESHLAKRYFADAFDLNIPESEIGYLIMYLASAVDSCRNKLKILLISDMDASFLFIIQQKLLKRAGEIIEIFDIMPRYLYEVKKTETSYDMIFTTEKELLFIQDIFLYINPMCDWIMEN